MLLRTLPDPVPPARHEIPPSYISRLATLHGLDINGLWLQVTQPAYPGAGRRIVVPERLAWGHPEGVSACGLTWPDD
ncbi:hypothetical protein ACTMTF_44355 [Nonomuraea sp. ZG12]|uniref:hypothetical protein n=1 Tax=Nonomuraea sp. ZG12 TaxID=3452207 RepID=UPI003F8C2D89